MQEIFLKNCYSHFHFTPFFFAPPPVGTILWKGAHLSMLPAPYFGMLLDLTGSPYPHIFTVCGIFGALGLGCLPTIYRSFIRLGGHRNYIAPGLS